jgi:glycosyltransferase involved in cell wall biosynthesis
MHASDRPRGRVLLAARWPVGGIRTHLACNHPALTAAGHLCSLVVPEGDFVPPLRGALPGADLIPVPSGVAMWRALREEVATGRYSLVHAHGLGAAAHAAFACVRQEAPLIVTLHEPLRSAQFAGLTGPGRRWLLGRALARAAAVVTVSDDARANLLRHFPNLRRLARRIHTVPNGIDASRFEGGRCNGDLRAELGVREGTTLIGFLGRFMPEKGFPLLLEAVRRLVRFGGVPALHVVAFGSSDYRREYEARIAREGLGGHVTLRDFVPDVAPILPQLDLVVVPSLWEASSLVSMEAMAAGVPVLGSDCPGLREVLRGTPSRTFPAGQVTALETELRKALAEPWRDEARRFAPQARQRFDNRRSAERVVELYGRVRGRMAGVAA